MLCQPCPHNLDQSKLCAGGKALRGDELFLWGYQVLHNAAKQIPLESGELFVGCLVGVESRVELDDFPLKRIETSALWDGIVPVVVCQMKTSDGVDEALLCFRKL